MKYSTNKKLNTLLNTIETEILERYADTSEAIAELERYYKEFSREVDYNYAQYGNCRCEYPHIYRLYREAGYTTTDKYSAERIWQTYQRQVGYVIRELLKAYAAIKAV